MGEDLRDRLLEALLESGNQSSAPRQDQLLAFFEDKRRDDVIMVQCRHLDLDPLDSVTANEADLRVPVLLPLRLAELEREVRREVVKKRNADREAQADAEVEVRAEVESDGGLADRIERAVSLGQEWVLGKAPQSLW